MNFTFSRLNPFVISLVVLVTAATFTGCQAPRQTSSRTQSAADFAARQPILTALGAESAYLLMSDNPSLVDLWAMDAQGLRQAQVSPRPQLFSMLDSSGSDAVMSAAGVKGGPISFEGGVTSDSFFWVDHGVIKPVVGAEGIGDNSFSPMLNSENQLAGQGIYHKKIDSIWTLNVGPFKNGVWRPKKILQSIDMGFIAWGPGSQFAVALGKQETGADRLKIVTMDGKQRDLGPALCANSAVWNTGSWIALGWMPERPGDLKCGPPTLVNPRTGARQPILAGWDPVVWSKDGTQLVLSRGHEIGLWRPGATAVTDVLQTPERVTTLVPIYAKNNILPK